MVADIEGTDIEGTDIEGTDIARAREAVAEQSRAIAAAGLTPAGSGNISMRIGNHVAITRGGLRLEAATAADVSVVQLDGTLLAGRRPSSETGLHLGVYRTTGERAIVHTHGMRAVALGLVRDEIPPVHYAIRRLGGRVPVVPYLVFGSPQLAAAVGEVVCSGARAALLRNHGAVACGEDLTQAVEHIQVLEWMCEVYLSAAPLGEPGLLTTADLDEMAAQTARIAYSG